MAMPIPHTWNEITLVLWSTNHTTSPIPGDHAIQSHRGGECSAKVRGAQAQVQVLEPIVLGTCSPGKLGIFNSEIASETF